MYIIISSIYINKGYIFSASNQKNVKENRRGNSKMDNPDKLATLCTQDTQRRQTKQKHNITQKTKNVSNTDLPKPGGEPRC